MAYGSLEAAEQYLALAERRSASVPEARREQLQLLLLVVRQQVDRQRGDLPAVTERARRLQAMAGTADTDTVPVGGEELRAMALISLGTTEFWAAHFADAEEHLEHGVALARGIGRSYLEFTGLAFQAMSGLYRPLAPVTDLARQAVELADRHGWTDDTAFGVACTALGAVLTLQVRPEEAEPWVRHAERILRAEAEPAAVAATRYVRGRLEQGRGRDAEALAAFQAAELLARRLATPHYLAPGPGLTRCTACCVSARPSAPDSWRHRPAPSGPRRTGPGARRVYACPGRRGRLGSQAR